METLVAENSFRTAKQVKHKPGTFEQAKKVLPVPYWEGHSAGHQEYLSAT